LNELETVFTNIDYFAERASNIELAKYKEILRSEHISSYDGSEQHAYFCAVPKSTFTCIGEAFPLLFIHCLYDFNDWEKHNSPYGDLDKKEWRKFLATGWIPDFLGISKDRTKIDCKIVREDEFSSSLFPVANELAKLAIQSPIQQVVRYGAIDAWNIHDYLIETKTEYIDFQYGTTA